MRVGIATTSAVLLAAMATAVPAQTDAPRVYSPQGSDNAPQVDLWLDQTTYRIGDRIAPHFASEMGAYVTIVRITSDGQLAVLYPRRPREQKPYSPSQLVNDRVPLYLSSDNRFQVEESRGVGFVFAIASWDRFNYDYYASGGDWSIGRLANDGRYGDPFEIVRRFVDRTLKASSDFSLDYVSYEVYNEGARSRYATRYEYDTYDDYYDSCLSAFGLRYTSYCRYNNYYPGYYGPYIVSQPRSPAPNTPVPPTPNYAGKKIHPVIGDPLVHGAPTEPEITEGRFPPNNSAEEAALAARRERMARQVTPRDRAGSTVDNAPVYREPRVYSAPTRTEPVYRQPVERQPAERPVYRPEPRIEQRAEPRAQPVTAPRVEVRNEPRQQQSAPAPRQTATPVAKDKDH